MLITSFSRYQVQKGTQGMRTGTAGPRVHTPVPSASRDLGAHCGIHLWAGEMLSG